MTGDKPILASTTNEFSTAALGLGESPTHGGAAFTRLTNSHRRGARPVLDLGIGSLDWPTDKRIDAAIVAVLAETPDLIHGFAPVRGFDFLREAVSARILRLHHAHYDPDSEILISPGGVKGALTVLFHTLLDLGDEVLIPIPNWPHYKDMLRLHGAVMRPIVPSTGLFDGLTVDDLDQHITPKTRMLILGDCINPTGHVYSTDELRQLSEVVATHNLDRKLFGGAPIEIIYDCPYEVYVTDRKPRPIPELTVTPTSGAYPMRACTTWISGPGKTCGMHGDRIGYVCARPSLIDVAARVQVNLNSFASTYAQIACNRAFQPDLDDSHLRRSEVAREALARVTEQLQVLEQLHIEPPDGGYFAFIDFSAYAGRYRQLGHESAAEFLLHEADVHGIDGRAFGTCDGIEHFARLNCGRSYGLLSEAADRIIAAVTRLSRLSGATGRPASARTA